MGRVPVIVVASDSMKGSLSSAAVGRAARAGIADALPGAEVRCVAVGDGGEGTMDALVDALGAATVSLSVDGPMGGRVEARYGWSGGRRMAVIELAQAAGLTLVDPCRRNPLLATTRGVGQLMLDALGRGARTMTVCLGGSATVDGGTGLLDALGARFLDAQGRRLAGNGAALKDVARIDLSGLDPRLRDCRVTIACDVDSPLCGPHGAARVFGPQKGADAAEVALLDKGLANLARRLREATGR